MDPNQLIAVYNVAPLAGAWIEMNITVLGSDQDWVAPLAGAWIEIDVIEKFTTNPFVAPLAGAWIEIFHVCQLAARIPGRSPRGSVD